MNTTACVREEDVFEAVMAGQLPSEPSGPPVNGELRGHVDSCPNCADLMTVIAVLRDDRDAAWRDAQLPTSGQVWWRAAMRRRTEAVEAASRPITMVQGLAFACAAGVAAAFITLAWPSLPQWTREGPRIGALWEVSGAAAAAAMPQSLLPVVAAVGACLVLTPLILYLALSDDDC